MILVLVLEKKTWALIVNTNPVLKFGGEALYSNIILFTDKTE